MGNEAFLHIHAEIDVEDLQIEEAAEIEERLQELMMAMVNPRLRWASVEVTIE